MSDVAPVLSITAHELRLDFKRGGRALWADFISSLTHPAFWAFATWLDIVTRYRRSRLGLGWAVIPAIIFVWGMGSFMAAMQTGPRIDFLTYVGLGYLLFRMIAAVMTESGSALLSHQSFILDGHVRLTDFILRVLAKHLFYFIVAMPVLAVALALASNFHPWGLIPATAGFLLVLFNLVWISIVVALMGTRYPDINEFVNSIFIFALLLTPIIWPASSAPVGTVRGTIMRINPLYHLIEVVRAPILGESVHPSTILYLAVLTLSGTLLATVLYRRYARFVPLWM